MKKMYEETANVMKRKTLFGMCFTLAATVAGAAYGIYIAKKRFPGLTEQKISELFRQHIPNEGVYVSRASGRAVFLSTALLRENREKNLMIFQKPIHPNSVEYVADLSDFQETVAVVDPSNGEKIGHVKERKDGSLLYEIRRDALRLISFEREDAAGMDVTVDA